MFMVIFLGSWRYLKVLKFILTEIWYEPKNGCNYLQDSANNNSISNKSLNKLCKIDCPQFPFEIFFNEALLPF